MKDETRKTLQSTVDGDPELVELLATMTSGARNKIVRTVVEPESTDPTPAPTPVMPSQIIRVGPNSPFKSLDEIDLNKAPNVCYMIEAGAMISVKRAQRISVPAVFIQGAGPNATLDCAALWKKPQLTFTKDAHDCALRFLRVCGHDGGEVVKLEQSRKFLVESVEQIEHPHHNGGVGVVSTDGSYGLTIHALKSKRTARYTVYCGDASGAGNNDLSITDFDFGPAKLVEDFKSCGRPENKPGHPKVVLSEHPFRIYGFKNLLMRNGFCRNLNNEDGKQAAKFMSGAGGKIIAVTFDGSVRCGRDVNDPATYTLRDLLFDQVKVTNWFRVDPGANVAMQNSEVHAFESGNVFDMHDTGRLSLKAVKSFYPGGKFSGQPGKIAILGEVFFNGKPVT